MKNLKKLGFIFSVGTIATFSLVGCGDDDDTSTPSPMGGSATTGGSSAGTGTSGTGTSGTATAGTGTSGTATGGSSAGTATGGGGSGTGGSTAGTGGSTAGTGGATGGGGAGGTGGATGGASGGGAGGATGGGGAGGGAGGAAPSADCKKWCQGAMGVVMECSANNLPDKISNEGKCLSVCAASPPASLTCWNMHLGFIIAGMPKGTHCPHAEGAPGNGACPELP